MGNILNLVFSNFDSEGKPLPNLEFMNQELNGQYLITPHILLSFQYDNLEIKICKLSDINKNENFYYVIYHTCKYENLISETSWVIPSDIELLIKEQNLKVIFLNEHESFVNVENDMKNLNRIILDKGLNPKNFYIVSNNSYLFDIKKKLSTGINVFKINYLLELVSKHMNVKSFKKYMKLDKKFIFLCQNRRPKSHRLLLLTYLDCAGLLDNEIIDWSLTYGKYNDYQLEMDAFDDEITTLRHDLILSYQKITEKPKLSYFEQNETWFNNVDDYSQCNHLSLKTFNESYINIITESHFDLPDIHITEKSFKPFYYFQLPIFVASYNHVKKLKEEYKFDVFDDLINHSYDNEEDDFKRFHMLLDEIKRLSKMKNEISVFYRKNIDRLLRNFEIVDNFKGENTIGNFFLSLTKSAKLI